MPKDYLDKIRAKYPQYADIPDTTLAQKIVAKYPEYQDVLGDMTHATGTPTPTPVAQSDPSYGQRIENQFNAAGNRLAGVGDVFQKNPIAGTAELGNATLQAAGALAAPITEIPYLGGAIKGVSGAVMGAGRGLFDLAVKGGSQVAENAQVPAFLRSAVPYSAYPSPQTRDLIQNKVGELGGNATGMALASAAPPMLGAASKLIPENLPVRLYTSALKPRFTKGGGLPGMSKNVQTGLGEGITVSEKGLSQLRDIEDQVNGTIASSIQKGADAGETVHTQPVIDKLYELKSKLELQATPGKALSQIDDAIEQFQNHPRAVDGQIPIDIAQKIKQGTYKGLAEKYGFEGSAAVEADKTIARNLKDQIAEQHPELTRLNARDGALIGLEDAMTRRVAQIRKSSIWPGRAAMEGAVGLATGRALIGGAAGMLDIVSNNPAVLSKLGIALQKARGLNPKPLPVVPPFIQAPQNQGGQ